VLALALMRNVPWLALVLACGRSPSPPATGSAEPVGSSGSAARAAPVDAGAAPAAAAGAAAALPDHARCSGHWVAKLEAYRDIDVVIAATPRGWQATVARPAGLTAASVGVQWSSEHGGSCRIQLATSKQPGHFDLELNRGGDLELGVIGRVQLASGECIARGTDGKFTFAPDNAPLPPIQPARAALAGQYTLAIPWPKRKCPVVPDRTLSFAMSIDRKNGDQIDASGLAWDLSEVRDNGEQQLYLRISKPLPGVADHFAEVVVLASVHGNTVTGTARFSTPENGRDDDAKLCEPAEVKIRGTLQPAP
jgi:hypothetical protein